ncbi:MAG: hypothetical protein ACM3SM_14285 [Bacteroidota bacterium]
MNRNKLEKLLYESFDRELNHSEKLILEEGLRSSAELAALKKEIFLMRESLRNSESEDFSAGFETRVLSSFNRRTEQKTSDISLAGLLSLSFGKIALAAVLVLIALTIYNVGTGNNSLIDNITGDSTASIESAFDPVNQINLQLIQQNN